MQTDVINTNFSKAFDSVNHSLILFKLDKLGFPCNLLTWISSYLNGRTQRIIFKNAVSKIIYVTSWVAQGSHLGLFCLLCLSTHSGVLMYPDDVKLVYHLMIWRRISTYSQILIVFMEGVSTTF